MSRGFRIMAEGDYALFTRPEMKVERVSYDVPTPGALEGMLKSIYWKPAIRYKIDKIIVFNPIHFTGVRGNEVKDKILFQNMKGQMNGKGNDPCIYTSTLEERTQRASMLLKDVCYGIEFHFDMTGLKSTHDDEDEKKHYNIIKRRLEKGQCFRTPCFGCAEFPVRKIELVEDFDMNRISPEIKAMGDVDLGFMSYRLEFKDNGIPLNNNWDDPIFSDKASTKYYRPHMINGIIDVRRYKEMMKC